MSTEIKFAVFQALILIPLFCGTICKKRFEGPERLARKIINLNLVLFQPLIILWSVWGMKMEKDLVYLPLAGLGLVAAGFLLGLLFAPATLLAGKSRAVFIISSSLANHGFTMGAFLCYLVAGDRGLSLALLFLAYYIPYNYGLIFPYARLASTGEGYSARFFRDSLLNIQNFPLYTVFAAILINLLHVEKPDILFPIDLLIMVSIALNYFAMGINFTFRGISFFGREQAILAAIKFLILPAAVFLILVPVDLSPDFKMVIKIQSFMPVAVYSVITAILFDLDSGLSTRLFVVNTVIFIALVLPFLMMFKEQIIF